MDDRTTAEKRPDPLGSGSPPPTEPIEKWPPTKRAIGMFVRPRATFHALAAHPTWVIAFLISAVFLTATSAVYMARVPYPLRREADLEKFVKLNRKLGMGPQEEQRFREEYARQTHRGETRLQKMSQLAYAFLNVLLTTLVGAALYQVGALLARDRVTFRRALAVRAYADMPPTVVLSVLVIIQMVLRSPEEIAGYRRLLLGNLGPLIEDKDAHITLATLANNLDLFQFWSLWLAALGLSIMLEKRRRGVAVGIVLAVWLLGLLLKVFINRAAGVVFI